jgi:adenylate cyclase
VFELTGTGHVHAGPERDEAHVLLVSDVTARSDGELLLAAARDEALAANQARSAFLAGLTHQLRTPLNAIIGYSELLREEADDPRYVDDIQRIEAAGRHLLDVITDVADVSPTSVRAELGIEVASFAVGDLVRELEATAHALASVNHNKLHVRCTENVGAMVSDPAKVAQVVTCLLSNACRFTERGQITLSVWREGSFVVFVVADTGIGLDAAELERLFTEPMIRPTSSVQSLKADGRGLTLSRRLARLLGGEVTVRSRKGEGSTFMARFAADVQTPDGRRSPGRSSDLLH